MMNDNDTWETLGREFHRSRPAINLLDDPRQPNSDHDVRRRLVAESDFDGSIRGSNRPILIARLGRRPLLMLAVLAALIASSYGGIYFWNYYQSYESTDDAQIDAHISPITSRITGTITQVYVEDYQRVKTGQLLVRLDPRDFQVAVEQARAQLAQAEADVDSGRQQYASALAELREGQAHEIQAWRAQQRYSTLLRLGVVPQVEYDRNEAITGAQSADVKVTQAEAAVALDNIAVHQAELEAAKIHLDEALVNLGYTRVVAPSDGILGKRIVELGQRVEPGQSLMTVTQDNGLWVTANFKETQLARMRREQAVTIRIDAIGRDFRAHIRDMPGDIGRLDSLLPLENTTGDYVEVAPRLPVRIAFDQDQDLSRLRPGMSAEPTVWLK